MRNYTDEQVDAMDKAFDLVKNKSNWKMPINKILDLPGGDEQIELITEAVIFYAGCVPDITKLPNGKYRVTAVGYYNAIGA